MASFTYKKSPTPITNRPELMRILLLLAVLFIGNSVLLDNRVQAQPATILDTPVKYHDAVLEARTQVVRFMEETQVPGLSIAVMKDGVIIWAQGFGLADLEQGVPVSTLTKMRIGSVSKPLSSAAMGRLVDEGKLDVEAEVQHYVPDFPRKAHPITVRQLAGHLAGIRHYRGNEFMSNTYYATVDEGLDMFKNDPLLFEPGTSYTYSSYGWNLLSAVVEGASEEPFLSYMRRVVIDEIGLNYTRAEYMDSLMAFRTRYYQKSPSGKVINAPQVDNSYKWAGGGYISTASDVVRFGHAILNTGFWSDATRELFFAPQQTSDGRTTHYGMGWRSGEDDAGRAWIGHSGGSVGGTTQFKMYPAEDLIICVISNLSNTPYNGLEEDLASLFME